MPSRDRQGKTAWMVALPCWIERRRSLPKQSVDDVQLLARHCRVEGDVSRQGKTAAFASTTGMDGLPALPGRKMTTVTPCLWIILCSQFGTTESKTSNAANRGSISQINQCFILCLFTARWCKTKLPSCQRTRWRHQAVKLWMDKESVTWQQRERCWSLPKEGHQQ